MRKELSVAVVVTNHNYRAYIAEAVESALAQSHPPECVIIVDDGSTDGSPEYLRNTYANDARVAVHCQSNAGQLASFCAGIRHARETDLVAFLDADDIWMPHYLSEIADIFIKEPSVEFVYADLEFFGAREGHFHGITSSRDDGISAIQSCYDPIWRGSPTSAIVIRRALALRILDVPAALYSDWRTRADDCLCHGADILGAHKYYLGRTLVRYRAHRDNQWLGKHPDPHGETRYWLRTQRMLSFYRTKSGLDPALRMDHLSRLKSEFLRKPQPTRKEFRANRRLLMSLPMTPRRLRHVWNMWWHYTKSSRSRN